MEEGSFSPSNTVFGIVLLALAGGFLSMLRTALANAGKPRLQSLAEAGNEKYRPVLEALEKSGCYTASLNIWIILLEILAGCLGAFGLAVPLGSLLQNLGLPVSAAHALAILLISCGTMAVFIVIGETILAQIALAFPEEISAVFLPFIRFISLLAFPIFLISREINKVMAKLLSAGTSRRGMTEDELRHALLEGEKSGVVESEERSMVEGVFYLGDRPVSVFMTHRSEIEWLDLEADPDEARRAAENSGGQFYLPVANGDLDDVAGVVMTRDIFRALLSGPWPGLRSIMRPPYFIPETMSALKAFEAFKKADASSLFVMDEYGGFAGMLTVRNLIEEITGELSASGDEEETIEKQDDGTWLADGGVSIDDAAAELELSRLGSGQSDYHTLAGFILDLAGEIPRSGSHVDYHGYRFKIVDMDGNRIDKIIISKTEGTEKDA